MAEKMAAGVAVDEVGAGEPVLLVHGTVVGGKATWRMQRPLTDRWRLLVMERRGYAPSPPVDREDYDRDTEDVVAVLSDHGPAHVVGHSYGAIAVLKAAATVPALVRSLTVIEPPAFALCVHDPRVAEMVADLEALFEGGSSDPEGFLRQFWSVTGTGGSLPDPLPPALAENAPLLMGQRPPWTAGIPIAQIAACTYPKLVVSGGHNQGFWATAKRAGCAPMRAFTFYEQIEHELTPGDPRYHDVVTYLRDITNSAGLDTDYIIDGPFVRPVKVSHPEAPFADAAGGRQAQGATG